MSTYSVTYPVTRAVTYPVGRALLGRVGTSPSPSNPEIVNYFDAFGGSNQTDGLSTSPGAVYVSATNKTWFGLEIFTGGTAFPTGSGVRQERVRVYDHTARTWSLSYNTGMSVLSNDSHGVPSLLSLADNRMLIFGGAHSTAMRVAHTTNADDPSAWTVDTALDNGDGGFTYPCPDLVGGVIHLFMREYVTSTAKYYLSLYKSTAITSGSPTWGTKIQLASMEVAGWTGARFYQGAHVVRGTDIYIPATRAKSDDGQRGNIYIYVYNTLDGSVRNFANTFSVAAGSLPVTGDQSSNFLIVDTISSSIETNIPHLTYDASGNAVLSWLEGPLNTGPYTLQYIKSTDGSTWSAEAKVGDYATDDPISQRRYDGHCIVAQTNGDLDFYWPTQSAAAVFQRGGNLSKRTLLAAGSFNTAAVVATCGATYSYCYPLTVLNGLPELQIMWSEISPNLVGSTDPAVGNIKSFAYGSGGYIQAPIYSTEALNFFARFGTTPAVSQKLAIDSFIKDLWAADAYQRMDDLVDLGLSDATAATLNLKGATYTATIDATATRVANQGVTGNGAHYSVNTGMNASTGTPKYQRNAASVLIRSRTAAQSTGQDISARNNGALGGTNVLLLGARTASDQISYRVNDGTVAVATVTDGSGLFMINRTGNTKSAHRNGVLLHTTSATTSTGIPDENFALSANLLNAGPTTRQYDIYGLGGYMGDIAAGINTAVVNYISAMGRT